MAAGDGLAMTYHLNRLAGTLANLTGPVKAANTWAGTSGRDLQGALNVKAGIVGEYKSVQHCLNSLAGTLAQMYGWDEAARRIP